MKDINKEVMEYLESLRETLGDSGNTDHLNPEQADHVIPGQIDHIIPEQTDHLVCN